MNIDMTRIRSAQDMQQAALEDARSAAQGTLYRSLQEQAALLTGQVPFAEQLSWGAKEQAARAILSGEDTGKQQALLEHEARVTGETPTGLAMLIVKKAARHREITATLSGIRRKYDAAFQSMATPDDIESLLVSLESDLHALRDRF